MVTEIMVKKLMMLLERRVDIENEEREAVEYGLGALMYTILSTLLLLLLGVYLGMIVPTIIVIAVFYLNQTVGGGYHAKTHVRCFVTMFLGLIVGLTIIGQKELDVSVFCLCGIVGSTILLLLPLTLNKNKKYMEYKAKQLVFRSRIVTVCEIIVLCVLFITNGAILKSLSAALILSGLSRVIGFLLNRNEKYLE